MSGLETLVLIAATCGGSAFGWSRVGNGLRSRGWPVWLRFAGGLLAIPVGGFGCFLTFGSLVGELETPVRWATGTCGALLLVSVFVAGSSARPRDQGKAPGRAAGLQSVASHLSKVAARVREQWRAAMADAQQKKVAAKPPPKPAPILPATFAFSYRDADGMVTERVVRIHTVEDAGGVAYLTGYCDLRKEERTFRSDRISGGFRLIYTPHTYTVREVIQHHVR